MGQNQVEDSIPAIVDTLLKRDCPEIYYWDGIELIGPIFIPSGFVPKYPAVIDHKDTKNLKEKLEQMKLNGEITTAMEETYIKQQEKSVGDLAEREAFDVLQEFCRSMPGTFLVIKGLNMMNIDPEKRVMKSEREMDFLVIDGTLGIIMNIGGLHLV